ncbi:hypothetical protein WMY93_000015 [Mugilogobius chulae]|uniref:Uncharacterized protein n=1 Tax=Mugilogobius chulae TaxID=88201 RepID=A0AAW0Q0Y0_9GOBI
MEMKVYHFHHGLTFLAHSSKHHMFVFETLNLTRPFSDHNLTAQEQVYDRHSGERHVIQNAFGSLAARRRILGRPFECLPDKAVDTIKAFYTDAATEPAARYICPSLTDSTSASGEVQ